MRTEIVKYVKDPKDPKIFLGVLVAIAPGRVGWSKTHENDRSKWNRKLGLKIARSRANATIGAKLYRVEETLPDDFWDPYVEMMSRSLGLPELAS